MREKLLTSHKYSQKHSIHEIIAQNEETIYWEHLRPVYVTENIWKDIVLKNSWGIKHLITKYREQVLGGRQWSNFESGIVVTIILQLDRAELQAIRRTRDTEK